MILSAHQCNFFPYEGVIEKVRSSDIFVSLRHVQFTRNNYHNRFKYQGRWHTMSVNQKLEPLAAKTYLRPEADWEKIVSRFSFLRDWTPLIRPSLVLTNHALLGALCGYLDIKTQVYCDWPNLPSGTERLVALCKELGADTYLSGPSGKNYLDELQFRRAGIKIIYQEPLANPRAAVELL